MSSETFSVNESPPKKPKLDEVDTTQNPPDSEDDSSDDEGFEHMTDEEIKEFQRYSKQLEESHGFDVDFVPKAYRSVIGSHIVPCNLNDPEAFEMTKKCTQFVVERYNELMKGKSRLQLVQIPRANWTPPGYMYNYYITFDAEDIVTSLSDTYQTLICHYPYVENIYVLSIKKKGQKEEIYFPVDLEDEEESVRMNKCVTVAISKHNEYQEGEPELEFVKVVKAGLEINDDPGIYRISFEAKDTKLNQINTYFAEMLYDPKHDNISMQSDLELQKEGDK